MKLKVVIDGNKDYLMTQDNEVVEFESLDLYKNEDRLIARVELVIDDVRYKIPGYQPPKFVDGSVVDRALPQAKLTLPEPEIDIPPGVGVERFLAMINERGLLSRCYTEPRYSNTLGHWTTDLIDVIKDGKVLATYDTVVTQYFTEQSMAKELDDLIKEHKNGNN